MVGEIFSFPKHTHTKRRKLKKDIHWIKERSKRNQKTLPAYILYWKRHLLASVHNVLDQKRIKVKKRSLFVSLHLSLLLTFRPVIHLQKNKVDEFKPNSGAFWLFSKSSFPLFCHAVLLSECHHYLMFLLMAVKWQKGDVTFGEICLFAFLVTFIWEDW